jgi:DNA-binding GntR family transcriptional regulator
MNEAVGVEDLGLVRLEPESVRRQAWRAIRARIVTGEIATGQIYSVGQFASRLGVSATPVREALLDLANEGLIEVVRNKGFRVVELSDKDLDELFELRMMLEAPTLAKVAGKLGAETLAQCRRYEQEMEELAALGDWVKFIERDRRFHLLLLEAYGNRRLVEAAGRVRAQTGVYSVPGLTQAGELGQAALEHRFILDAIERGDADQVEALMRRHLEHARRRCSWFGQAKATGERAG